MRVADILTRDTIALGQELGSKQDVLLRLIELIKHSGVVEDPEKVQRDIFAREEIMSTGVGNGFACPHAKTAAVRETAAAMLTLAQPVDFQSLDGKPVSIVIMLVGPEQSVGTHLRLLSRVSRLMNDAAFRAQLLAGVHAESVLHMIDSEEASKLDI